MTSLPDDGIVVAGEVGRHGSGRPDGHAHRVGTAAGAAGDDGSDAQMTMCAEAHRIGMEGVDRRLRDMEERLERRLSELRFDLLKWNFLLGSGSSPR